MYCIYDCVLKCNNIQEDNGIFYDDGLAKANIREEKFSMLKLIFFLQCLLGVISQNLSTLEFVQIWFRHGERLPTHYITFPNEPPLDFDYREIAELGELTTEYRKDSVEISLELRNIFKAILYEISRGVQQEYQVGSYIRDYYGPFFNYTYRPSEVHIWTGKDNRTVASALALVAGVYPPIGAQIWNATLNWQPVVVHTDETIDWVSTGIENECPMFEKNFFASPGFQSTLSDVDPHFIEFLRNNTGAPIDEPIDFNRVIDSLKVKRWDVRALKISN
uniref:Histidine acid phosphatase n=1 Tax=Heterorhabditis bacteriophora TaxID=37862 RepID=A0A1I7X610_HETBA